LGRKSYENDMELKPDLDIHALYGFSGGAYNVWWRLIPLTQVRLYVVRGVVADRLALFLGLSRLMRSQ
jgi:hypothetical protein